MKTKKKSDKTKLREVRAKLKIATEALESIAGDDRRPEFETREYWMDKGATISIADTLVFDTLLARHTLERLKDESKTRKENR